jgi:hypothetical protein
MGVADGRGAGERCVGVAGAAGVGVGLITPGIS